MEGEEEVRLLESPGKVTLSGRNFFIASFYLLCYNNQNAAVLHSRQKNLMTDERGGVAT